MCVRERERERKANRRTTRCRITRPECIQEHENARNVPLLSSPAAAAAAADTCFFAAKGNACVYAACCSVADGDAGAGAQRPLVRQGCCVCVCVCVASQFAHMHARILPLTLTVTISTTVLLLTTVDYSATAAAACRLTCRPAARLPSYESLEGCGMQPER